MMTLKGFMFLIVLLMCEYESICLDLLRTYLTCKPCLIPFTTH